MARWQSAILLHSSPAGRRLWQLSASGDHFTVQSEKALLSTDPLPSGLVGKDWHTLIRPKLNIAWLPADKIFLRAVQLPASEAADIAQMVELQMEKLSPLPVTHVVWSVFMMPRPAHKPDALQTVIVIIASRKEAEDFLGQLETQGFMADRLEAPGLDELLSVDIREEGVWLVPGAPGEPALVAWWYGDAIQNITLVALPPGPERGAQLKTQIEQIAWAGELEGWLTSAPKVHLVASPQEARFWEPIFHDLGDQLSVVEPLPEAQLVARGAQRCAQDARTNLVPPEFAKRYRQQFVDGLWMRGVFAVLSLYIIGVLIYFGALYALKLKFNHVKGDLASISQSYTNAMRDSDQLDILKNRSMLKFAALDCWRAVAVNLPESVTIDDFHFDHQKLELRGSVPSDDQVQVLDFNEKLRHVANPDKPGELLFSQVDSPPMTVNGDKTDWRFSYNSRMLAVNNFLGQLNLTPQERRIVVIIFLVCIVVLNLLFVWPHFGEWGSINKQLEAMRRNISNDNRLIQQDLNPTNGYKVLVNQLSRLEGGSVMEHPVDPQVKMGNTLRSQERKTGVFIDNFGQITFKTNEFFEELTTVISVDSQEPELVNFLYNMGMDPAMIRVARLDLKPADANRYKLKGGITLTANYTKRQPSTVAPATAKAPAVPKPAAAPGNRPQPTPINKPPGPVVPLRHGPPGTWQPPGKGLPNMPNRPLPKNGPRDRPNFVP